MPSLSCPCRLCYSKTRILRPCYSPDRSATLDAMLSIKYIVMSIMDITMYLMDFLKEYSGTPTIYSQVNGYSAITGRSLINSKPNFQPGVFSRATGSAVLSFQYLLYSCSMERDAATSVFESLSSGVRLDV